MTETQAALQVIEDAERVAALLPPLRQRILEALAQPDSASGVARRLGLPRQKVNYHLRELEKGGFVELVEERRRRGCVERIVRASAERFLVSPVVLGELAGGAEAVQDRFSSAYLIVGAARLMRDVTVLRRRAREVGKRLATFSVEVDVSFSSPADLRAFSEELAAQVARLASKYDRPADPPARRYHFLVGGHPTITKTPDEAAAEARAHQRALGDGQERPHE